MFRKKKYSLLGEKVILVPYSHHHVEKYHGWMQDPALQVLTASEPLSLQQEYELQLSWLRDDDKSTFIILSRELHEQEDTSEIDCMVGDVNMFLVRESEDKGALTAEIDIMIAESSFRGRGLGLEASLLMMAYGVYELEVRRFRAKVGLSNKASFSLFKNKLKFKELSQSDIFKEVTLELLVDKKEFARSHKPNQDLKWSKYTPEKQKQV